MKFQLITALLAGAAAAAPTNPSVQENQVEKRVLDPVSIAILGSVVSGVVGASVTQGYNLAKEAADWTEVSRTLLPITRSVPMS
jgi:hypothetical protein